MVRPGIQALLRSHQLWPQTQMWVLRFPTVSLDDTLLAGPGNFQMKPRPGLHNPDVLNPIIVQSGTVWVTGCFPSALSLQALHVLFQNIRIEKALTFPQTDSQTSWQLQCKVSHTRSNTSQRFHNSFPAVVSLQAVGRPQCRKIGDARANLESGRKGGSVALPHVDLFGSSL